jgi:hypothetical protein
MKGGSKGKRRGCGRGGALPVTMAVRPAAERPWVTWSAVEAQEKPEAPFRLKIHGSIVASGGNAVIESINRSHAEMGGMGKKRSAVKSSSQQLSTTRPPDVLCILYAVLFFSSQCTQCLDPISAPNKLLSSLYK